MHCKTQLILILALIVTLFGCVDADDKKTYHDITFEECEIKIREFKKHMEEEIFPIVNISKADTSKASNMIHSEIINELKKIEYSIELCSRKQLYSSDSEQRYDYNLITQDLFSMVMFMGNIRDNRASGTEFLNVLFGFMRKNYYKVMESI